MLVRDDLPPRDPTGVRQGMCPRRVLRQIAPA